MARKPMVTRTIKTTEAVVLCLVVKTGETRNQVVTLPRTYKTKGEMLKQAKAVLETDELIVLYIVSAKEKETLYGMTEQEFICFAKEMAARTKKETEE